MFAHRKRNDFMWAGLVEFIEGMYLPMSFGVAINTSIMAAFFRDAAIGINNTYAIVIGVVLGLTPIVLSCKLNSGWKSNRKAVVAARE